MAEESLGWDEIERSASYVRGRSDCRPTVIIVTGSGLGALADEIEAPTSLPYPEIPHFSPTSVLGHAGTLVLGELAGKGVALMQGRVHFYEGYSLQRATFPIRVLTEIGLHSQSLFLRERPSNVPREQFLDAV